jgi:CRP-like cAMP-binding protein
MRKALHLMGFLDDLDVQWMGESGSQHQISAGTVLIREGTPIDSLYVVLDGALSVCVAAHHEKSIATLFSGEIVGEMSLVRAKPPSASVVALEDSHVLAVPLSRLSLKLAKDNAFAARFYHAVAAFLADRLSVTVGRFGYGSAQQDVDPDELDDSAMDEIALAANRFDDLLKSLRLTA